MIQAVWDARPAVIYRTSMADDAEQLEQDHDAERYA